MCLLHGSWLPDALMQNIAMENNLSETAFVLRRNASHTLAIRWFTPLAEVRLCGHATLAAAHALFVHEKVSASELCFESLSGMLTAHYEDDLLTLDFPRDTLHTTAFTPNIDCFQYQPKEVWRGTDEYLFVFKDEGEVRNAVCNMEKAAGIDRSGIIITAQAAHNGIDFVSRYFSPKFGLPEDPVTGSAHTLLVPYWQSVTGKDHFHALQISKRGGELYCRAKGDRIKIGGKAVTYFAGELCLPCAEDMNLV